MYELASRKQRIADLMSFDSLKSGAEYDFFSVHFDAFCKAKYANFYQISRSAIKKEGRLDRVH
ncbi:hypothetical protein [Serratia plymuthica]|uniref:hypothetical protein n=1 Tax=Serratia plymuthica TaxID=82996 RepID=UPI00390CCE43